MGSVKRTVFLKFVPNGNDELSVLREIQPPDGFNRIPKLLSVHAVPSGSIMVTNYAGAPLSDCLNFPPRALTVYDFMAMARHLIYAVSSLHKKRVVHCDIKPDNIVFDPGPRPGILTLVDFGLAEIVKDGDEETDDYVGTSGWVAPEVLQGEMHNKMKTDVWACGRVLAHMLLFCPANETYDKIDKLHRILTEPPDQRPDLTELPQFTTFQNMYNYFVRASESLQVLVPYRRDIANDQPVQRDDLPVDLLDLLDRSLIKCNFNAPSPIMMGNPSPLITNGKMITAS